MNPNLEHLIVLQAQDLDLQRFRDQLAALPASVSKARAALESAKTAEAALAQQQLTEEKLRRDQESEIASHRTKLERLQRSLNGATNSTQVAAFEHEIAFSRAAIDRLEEEELASMERSEAITGRQADARANVQRLEVTFSEETARAEQQGTEWKESIAGIEQQRLALRAQIDEHWLATYDRLRKHKGTAVAEALGTSAGGKCAACQMAVRPPRWQVLTGQGQEEMLSCESCGRILFWDPRRDTPRAWEAGDRYRRATGTTLAGSSR